MAPVPPKSRGDGFHGSRRGAARSRLQTALFALLALLVAIGFLGRRTGLVPGGTTEAFDPAQYRDAPTVAPGDAGALVGERAVVCGPVVNAVYASATQGQPTFLNLQRPYPDQPFDAVIWGRDRERFPRPPEVVYRERNICVMGRVTEHEGVPRIEVREPAQVLIR